MSFCYILAEVAVIFKLTHGFIGGIVNQ